MDKRVKIMLGMSIIMLVLLWVCVAFLYSI